MACYIKIKHHKGLHTYSRSNRVKKNLGTLKNTDGKNRCNTRQRKYQTKRPMSVKNNYYINKKEKKKHVDIKVCTQDLFGINFTQYDQSQKI